MDSARNFFIFTSGSFDEVVMKVTLVQSDPVWGDPAASLSRIEGKLKDSGMTDLIVLPEMFSTGFVASPAGLAEEDTGSGEPESLGWMRTVAYERNCAVAGSLAFHHGGTYRNRFYFVFPDGKEVHYDKHHLFTYAGEHLRFTAGKERVIVRYRDFRILLQVCYDLRFPAFSRNRMGPDGPEYDLAGATDRGVGRPSSRPGDRESVLCGGCQPGRKRSEEPLSGTFRFAGLSGKYTFKL